MFIDEKLAALWDSPEGRALIFRVMWYISLGMMVLGYIIIGYMLFIQ